MTGDGMRQAVVAHLVKQPEPVDGTRQAGRSGWSSLIRTGDGPGADPDAIEFVKTRSSTSCHLLSVSYINHRGWTMHDLIKMRQEADGAWRVHVGEGGVGPDPLRNRPWVNFCAGFGPQNFTGRGHVVGDGAERAVSVRPTFANDIVIKDTVDNGFVLSFEPRAVVCPADVSMLDRDGTTLVSYQEFGDFAPLT